MNIFKFHKERNDVEICGFIQLCTWLEDMLTRFFHLLFHVHACLQFLFSALLMLVHLCVCVCLSCTWRGIWHSASPALFSRIFSSLSHDFFPLHYLSFSLLLGQVLAFCFVLALLVKLELEREMKFKSSYLGAYNIAALITD